MWPYMPGYLQDSAEVKVPKVVSVGGCQYRRDGDICLKAATEDRSFPLPNDKDQAQVLFCFAHALAFDAIEWARRKKESENENCDDHP